MITPNQFAKQMIELQKTSFISCYEAASTLQAKAGSTLDRMLGQAQWIPSESRKMITDWLSTCNQERDRFKAYVEKSYANLGMYFAKEAVAKAGKPSGQTAKTSTVAEPEKKAPTATAPEKKASAAAAPEKKAPAAAEPGKKASVAAEPEKPAPSKTAGPAESPKAAAAGSKPMKNAAAKKTAAVKKGGKAVLK